SDPVDIRLPGRRPSARSATAPACERAWTRRRPSFGITERFTTAARTVAQEFEALFRGQRLGQPVPLDFIATLFAQVLHLLGGLDSLRDHIEPERMGHVDDRGRDRLVVRI